MPCESFPETVVTKVYSAVAAAARREGGRSGEMIHVAKMAQAGSKGFIGLRHKIQFLVLRMKNRTSTPRRFS